MRARPGDPVRASMMNRALDGADAALNAGLGLGSRAGRRGPQQLKAEVTALANDYLTVRRVNYDGSLIGPEFDVAKPETLRHDADLYDWPTSLETENTNEVEVSDGESDYTWIVTPVYRVGDRVEIKRVDYSGVEVAGSDLKWQEAGPARTWAVEESEEESE